MPYISVRVHMYCTIHVNISFLNNNPIYSTDNFFVKIQVFTMDIIYVCIRYRINSFHLILIVFTTQIDNNLFTRLIFNIKNQVKCIHK